MSTQKRVTVPDGLRDVLLEFSIAYLLEPTGSDVVDFAVDFFTKKQENRRATKITGEPMSPDEESIISQEEGK